MQGCFSEKWHTHHPRIFLVPRQFPRRIINDLTFRTKLPSDCRRHPWACNHVVALHSAPILMRWMGTSFSFFFSHPCIFWGEWAPHFFPIRIFLLYIFFVRTTERHTQMVQLPSLDVCKPRECQRQIWQTNNKGNSNKRATGQNKKIRQKGHAQKTNYTENYRRGEAKATP